ncbi:unnamed protein product, partial [Mesorhabditis spiculigera]
MFWLFAALLFLTAACHKQPFSLRAQLCPYPQQHQNNRELVALFGHEFGCVEGPGSARYYANNQLVLNDGIRSESPQATLVPYCQRTGLISCRVTERRLSGGLLSIPFMLLLLFRVVAKVIVDEP